MDLIVITLVHGTFAPDAEWVKAGSFLRERIRESLGDNVEFVEFQWSGRNSHSARIAAGSKLTKQLLKTVATYSGASHYVIAHSHGGNVVLYALREPRLRQRIRGVVSLATPFIRCTPRDLEFGLMGLVWLLVVGVPLALMGLGYLAIQNDYGPLGIVLWVAAVIPLLFVRIRGGYLPPNALPSVPARGSPERAQIATRERLQPPPPGVPMLCARVRGDEAQWALDTVHWWTNFPFRTLVWVLAVTFISANALLGIVWLLGVYSNFFPLSLEVVTKIATPLGVLASYVFLGFGACAVWYLAMVVVPRFRIIAFGHETVADTLYTRITVAPLPQDASGDLEHREYDVSASASHGRRRGPALNHCVIYNDEAVLDDIVRWIRARRRC